MGLIAHLVAGFALGSAFKVSLWILVPAALGLHVLLDLVPHWDYGFSLLMRRPSQKTSSSCSERCAATRRPA